ncbi:MAG: HAMP domain-containing histidine kinase [Ruminococcaceae bacterium]|nr:HAMP domain-containing histidine kinase [Oscillospiraceae bacterium]
MLKKLRIKFVCIVMIIVTVMLVIIMGGMVHFTKKDLQQSNVQMMYSVAQRPFIPDRPPNSRDEISLPYLVVKINRDGSTETTGNYSALTDTDFVQEIIHTANQSSNMEGEIKEYSLRYIKVDIPENKIVFADISSEIIAINKLLKNCIAVGVTAFFAFFVLTMYLSKWAISPVEEAWAQQRQFVADASHELKTPLAVILTNAELLKSDDYTQQEKNQFTESLLVMSRHMRSLVEGLLELVRFDSGNIKTTIDNIDASAVIEDAILPFEPMFFEQGLVLNSDIQQGIKIKASSRHITQLTNILLDNALKYSYKDTHVNIRLKKQGSHCIISVSGQGDSINNEDLKNIFKRFYRTDKARSRDGSFGLGLAIAQSIVREHSGQIWADSTNGTNTFYVMLPL